MKKVVILGLVLVTVLIIIGCGESSSTGKVVLRSPLTTCKDIQVPYEATEYYTEKEPYQAIEEYQVNLKYQVIEGYHRGSISDITNYKEKGIVSVRNVDTETGLFTVQISFTTLNRGTETFNVNNYIMPGETVEFDKYYDVNLGEDISFNYRVIPGQKTLTKTVTRYRDVEKTRTVTKYRTEQKCD